jgi:predicted  nucleic acid-binding Zn-ribbon protein
MKTEKENIKEQLDNLNHKVDKMERTIYRIEADTIAINKQLKELSEALYKHINFIDKTYDGLKNPIEAARKFLRR